MSIGLSVDQLNLGKSLPQSWLDVVSEEVRILASIFSPYLVHSLEGAVWLRAQGFCHLLIPNGFFLDLWEEQVPLHEVVHVNNFPVLEIESVRVDELLCCVIDKRQLWWHLEFALKDSNMVSRVLLTIDGPPLSLNRELADILEAYCRSQEHLKSQAIHPLSHPERDLSQLSHELHGLEVLLSGHLFFWRLS